MSNAALGMTMLGLIVVVIMMGFPTAFTLMGLGMVFGYIAFYNPAAGFLDNRVFDLMVQRAFGAMTNENLEAVQAGVRHHARDHSHSSIFIEQLSADDLVGSELMLLPRRQFRLQGPRLRVGPSGRHVAIPDARELRQQCPGVHPGGSHLESLEALPIPGTQPEHRHPGEPLGLP